MIAINGQTIAKRYEGKADLKAQKYDKFMINLIVQLDQKT
jgi:hypothetical protein